VSHGAALRQPQVGSGLNHSDGALTPGGQPPEKGNATAVLDTPEQEWQMERNLALVVFPIAVSLAVLFEAYHFRWSEVDWSLRMDRSDGLDGSERVDNSFHGLTSGLSHRAYKLGRIYFAGAGKVKGRSYVLMLFCHNLFGQYLNLVNFNFQRRIWNLYQHPSMALFTALIANWIILYTVMSLTAVYSQYTEGMLTIHWRDHMTRYFNSIWLPNSYAFKLKDDRRFDNPDQRIQEDVSNYVGLTFGMTLGLWNSVTNLFIYGYMLFTISPTSFFGYCNIPGWLFYVAVAYSAFGSGVMHYLGSDLAHFSWLGERYGGNFRAELRRAFDQAETTAALRSQDAEAGRLQNRFEHIKMITWRSMMLNKKLNWFNHFYGPFSSILFMVILMPFFIRGQVDLGRIKQCEMALGQVSGALNYFVGNYGQLASYRAVVDRLYNFRTSALEYMQEKISKQEGPLEEKLLEVLAAQGMPEQFPALLGGTGGKIYPPSFKLALGSSQVFVPIDAVHEPALALELTGVTLLLPTGEALLRKANLCIPKGTCALICGKEGAGKSTLLRALAGIWPYMSVDGQTGAEDTVLINQKPRLPSPMSLREAVTFPNKPGSFSDDAILAVLEQVKLSTLAVSGLDVTIDVNSVLSGGEFQRLMVAHCLLAKPRWVLLDEAMAHLSRENQLAMYSLLRSELVVKCGCSFVSTSHDWRALAHFHDVHYIIETDDFKALEGDCNKRAAGRLVAFDPTQEVDDAPVAESMEVLRSNIAEKDAEIDRLKEELARNQDDLTATI